MRPYCSGGSGGTDGASDGCQDGIGTKSSGSDGSSNHRYGSEQLIAAVRSKGAQQRSSSRDDADSAAKFPAASNPAESSAKSAAETSAPPLEYDLAAMVHHSGSLDGGHYTAQCRHPGSSKWHNFDDAAVSDAVPTLLSASAYVLFYVRRQ